MGIFIVCSQSSQKLHEIKRIQEFACTRGGGVVRPHAALDPPMGGGTARNSDRFVCLR